MPFDNQRDQRPVTVDDLNNWHWDLCNPNPSKYDAKKFDIFHQVPEKGKRFFSSILYKSVTPEKKLEDE